MRRVKRSRELFHITREQQAFCHKRVRFLLDDPERSLLDLLGNAYTQGLIDATEMADRRTSRDIITISGPRQ